MSEEVLGDITSRWDEEDRTIQAKSWVRSCDQRFVTRYGEDFRVHIEMQRVTTDQDHKLLCEEHVASLWTRASDCATDPELGPHALAIQHHMTALTEILWRREKDRLTTEAQDAPQA